MRSVRFASLALLVFGCSGSEPLEVPRPEDGLIPEAALATRTDELARAVQAAPGDAAAWTAYGEFLFDSELWSTAVRALDAGATTTQGENAWRLRYLAAIAASKVDPQAAVDRLRVLIEEDPDYAPARVRLGLQLARSFDLDEGLAVLEEARRIAPDSLDAASAAGMVLTDLARFEEARPLLEATLERSPSRREAHAPLARCLFALGEKETARRHADAGARTQGVLTAALPRDDPRGQVAGSRLGAGARMDEADAALDRGDHAAAIAAYSEVADLEPDHHVAWLGWSKALALEGQIDQAIEVLRRGLEHSPAASTLHDQLAGIHMMRGDWEAAVAPLDRALELRPGSPESLTHRAQLATSMGQPEEALRYLEESLALDTNASASWLERARAETLLRRDLGEVRATVAEAARCSRVSGQALERLGGALAQRLGGLKLLDEAAREITSRIDDPVQFARWIGRAWLQRRKGDRAEPWLARALEATPQDARLRLEVSRASALWASTILGSDYQRARALLQRSIELDPAWPFAARLLAWSLATDARGLEPERALRLAEQAQLAPGPKDPLVDDALAAALAANGRFEQALEVTSALISNLPPELAPRLTPVLQGRLAKYSAREAFTLDPARPLPEQR